MARYVSIWFRYLLTDWFARRQPALLGKPVVLKVNDHGRAVIARSNAAARMQGLLPGMPVADAKALVSDIVVLDDPPEGPGKLLTALGRWCIRYSPVVAVDMPEGLLLDASGCAHLWGGEQNYVDDLRTRLAAFGYDVRIGMADTIGCAWAVARYGGGTVVAAGQHLQSLLPLPPSALRLPEHITSLLEQLGLSTVQSFFHIQRSALRRRFGVELLKRMDQAMGRAEEVLLPLVPLQPYQERLPCLEPIMTRKGIEIALGRLLESLCHRLRSEQKGVRKAVLSCYRVERDVRQVEIGTNRASHNTAHLFGLFDLKIADLAPGMGIELFILEAIQVEDAAPLQESIWQAENVAAAAAIAELIDKLEAKLGPGKVQRYLPAEHYWPEHSVRLAQSLRDQPGTAWRIDRIRPIRLLSRPEPIQVSAPIPDYPPMLFRYNGNLHRIKKADGPERIEGEWWHKKGEHRDYYVVEDEQGMRYWLFRQGHYDADRQNQWFIHGFFA